MQFHFAASLLTDEGLSPPSGHGYCFGPVAIKPASRGRVTLRAPVPDAKPRVLSNFLTHEDDLRSMIAGVKMALEIGEQEPLRGLSTGPYSVPASDSRQGHRDLAASGGPPGLPPHLHLCDRRGGGPGPAGSRI